MKQDDNGPNNEDKEIDEFSKILRHSLMYHSTLKDKCQHDFQGWREFEDGRGGERVCTKCGLGAMAHTLRNCP